MYRLQVGQKLQPFYSAPFHMSSESTKSEGRQERHFENLKRDVKRGAFGRVAFALGIGDHLDLGMRQTGAPMPTAPDDIPALGKDGAHERVGRRLAPRPPGQAQRIPHQLFIAWHRRQS